MPVAALTVELVIPGAHSLKEKRAVIRPILDGSRHRFSVAAAEVGHQDLWGRATLAFASVAGTMHHAGDVLDSVERFVWSLPEIDISSCRRDWLEQEED
jgi:uncharacterized protein YlxP (DUF503 family)